MGTESREEGSARQRGMEMMEAVYGFSVDPDTEESDYLKQTVDHLFGEIWSQPELTIRDRRLITIGAIAAMGIGPLLEVQFKAALDHDELDKEQVRALVVHLAHYVGWPLSTVARDAAEKAIAGP
jgi:4-carboxymuconolactone decarboxylase